MKPTTKKRKPATGKMSVKQYIIWFALRHWHWVAGIILVLLLIFYVSKKYREWRKEQSAVSKYRLETLKEAQKRHQVVVDSLEPIIADSKAKVVKLRRIVVEKQILLELYGYQEKQILNYFESLDKRAKERGW